MERMGFLSTANINLEDKDLVTATKEHETLRSTQWDSLEIRPSPSASNLIPTLGFDMQDGRITGAAIEESNVREMMTAWNKVLVEKLTVSLPVNKFPVFYGTQGFTEFRAALVTVLGPIKEPILFHTRSSISVLILSCRLRLGLRSGLFPSDLPIKIMNFYLPQAC
jgi:hypothetical protein